MVPASSTCVALGQTDTARQFRITLVAMAVPAQHLTGDEITGYLKGIHSEHAAAVVREWLRMAQYEQHACNPEPVAGSTRQWSRRMCTHRTWWGQWTGRA